MKTACIIAEYHPFHNAHARMAAQLHGMGYEAVIAVMSGNFVQRGTPALLPKQVRAAAALACGVDLAVELPCRAAAATAQRFAAAGVAAAAALGADVLAFGAEDADPARLAAVVDALEAPAYPALLKAGLDEGLPFFAARANAAEQLCPGAAALLAKPNNILAVEYMAALAAMQKQRAAAGDTAPLPRPLPLPRTGAAYDGEPDSLQNTADSAAQRPDAGIASAGWLRERPMEEWAPYVPAAALELYQKAAAEGRILDSGRWQTAALALLRSRTAADLAALPDAAEGLDALLGRAIRECTSLEELYARVKSKRYAHARIRRLVLAAALGWRAGPAEAAAELPYLRVLGATAAGRQVLSAAAKSGGLPVSSSLAALERLGGAAAEAARRESAAGDLYALALQAPEACGTEYRLKFIEA